MFNLKSWLIPVVIAGLLFIVVRPIFAQALEVPVQPLGEIEVDSEVVGGYHQVFYLADGEKIFITEGNLNATSPVINGEYIAYRKNTGAGVDGIFLHHIPGATTIQLSVSGNNANPVIDESGRVVWEGRTDGAWQVFLFDGVSVRQLSNGFMAVNPDIEGDNIVYAGRDAAGTWQSVGYSILRNKLVQISTGVTSKHPKLVDGEVYLGSVGDVLGEQFPLNVDDLFLLGFDEPPPQAAGVATESAKTVTVEEMIEELTASPSAEVEIPASGSGSFAQ